MKHGSTSAVTPTRASLHIEELVIRGLPILNRDALAEAVETRLTLLLAEMNGAIIHPAARLIAPTIRIAADATAEQIGNKIARTICDALASATDDPGRTNMRAGGANQTTATIKTQDV